MAMEKRKKTPRKKMFEYLPAIYQEGDSPDSPSFLREFLEAFELVLLGADKGAKRANQPMEGLGQKIERLHAIFDPEETPDEFLPWLAGWAALTLNSHLSPERKRGLVAKIIPLYRIRGTKSYLEQLLDLCVDVDTSVSEEEIPPMQLGERSTLGWDTHLGGGPPHFFRVTLVASKLNAQDVQAQRQFAYEVIELAKPAHTTYDFDVIYPHMQLGTHSTVGLDTVLGPAAAS